MVLSLYSLVIIYSVIMCVSVCVLLLFLTFNSCVSCHPPSLLHTRSYTRYWQSLQRIDDIFDLNPNSQKYSRHVAAFVDVERHLPRVRSHLNLQSGGSVSSGRINLGTNGGIDDGGGLAGPYFPIAQADAEDELPRSNNELLNIVLSGNSALDTSALSTYSTPAKRKKRIPGAAKSAFQRSPLDDL